MPEVLSIEPRKGIKSGGTLLKITGKHLSCGSDLKFIMDGSNCSIINITTQSANNNNNENSDVDIVYCRTPPYNPNDWNQKGTFLQMKMDDYVQSLNETKFKFDYVDDPRIVSIEPDRTIISGGLFMTIKGRDFDTIQSTHLILSPTSIMPNQRSYESSVESKNSNFFKSVSSV